MKSIDDSISLHNLKVFCRVVRHQSVTRAAEELHIAQPAVTAHVRALERKLGARLVVRQGRTIEISEAGRTLHAWASDMLNQYRDLERRLRGYSDGERGSAVISASMTVGSYILPTILARFRQANPYAEIRASIFHPLSASQQVRESACDFAILHMPSQMPMDGLVAEKLGSEDLILVAAADDRRIGATVTLPELQRLPFVAPPSGQTRRDLEEEALRSYGVGDRQIVIELGHPEALKRAILQGLGVGLLFRSSVEDHLADGTLREVRLAGARMLIPLMLVRASSKTFSRLQERLIEHIRAELAHRTPAANAPRPAAGSDGARS